MSGQHGQISIADGNTNGQLGSETSHEDYYGDRIVRGSDGSIFELLDHTKRPPLGLFEEVVDEIESKLVQPYMMPSISS